MNASQIWELAGILAIASLNRASELFDHASQDQLVASIRVTIADELRAAVQKMLGSAKA